MQLKSLDYRIPVDTHLIPRLLTLVTLALTCNFVGCALSTCVARCGYPLFESTSDARNLAFDRKAVDGNSRMQKRD